MKIIIAVLFLIFLLTNLIMGRWGEVITSIIGIVVFMFFIFLFSYTDKID